MVKDFVVLVIKGRGFTEGLLATSNLRGGAIVAMTGIVAQFPHLGDVLSKEGGD
jgi:hypothetical protein